MVLTTELIIFETSDAFRSNPDIITSGFDIVLKSQGAHSPGYYGKQLENPSTGYVFLHWDSYEAHKAVMDGPSFTEIAESLQPSLGGKMQINHIQFSGPTTALDRPVTSVLIFTLKAPEHREAVVDILTKISEAYDEFAYGKTREDENRWIAINGWSTVEEHFAEASKPEMVAAVDKMASYATIELLFHIKLAQRRL